MAAVSKSVEGDIPQSTNRLSVVFSRSFDVDSSSPSRESDRMSNLLAIDFGERRIGVAWTSAEGGSPEPLTTLVRRSDRQAIAELRSLAREYEAAALVVGEPLDFRGKRGENCERVRRFADKLHVELGLPITLQPETLTTVAAKERLASLGIDARRFKPGLDAMAAAMILEEFLARQHDENDGSASSTNANPHDDSADADDAPRAAEISESVGNRAQRS